MWHLDHTSHASNQIPQASNMEELLEQCVNALRQSLPQSRSEPVKYTVFDKTDGRNIEYWLDGYAAHVPIDVGRNPTVPHPQIFRPETPPGLH